MANPLAGNVNLFRQGAADLQNGLATLQASMNQVRLQRLLGAANDRAQEIRTTETNENKQRESLLALSQQLAFNMAGLGVDPSKVAAFTQAPKPEKDDSAKIDRDLFVPGFGVGINKKAVQQFTTQQEGALSSLRLIQRIRSINQQSGEAFSPGARTSADSLRTQLTGKVRVALTGPGNTSDKDMDRILSTIPHAASFFELDSNTEVRLNELETTVRSSLIDGAINAGFNQSQVDQRLQSMGLGGGAQPGSPQANSFGSSFKPVGGR